MFGESKSPVFSRERETHALLTLISYYIIKQAVLCYFQYKLSFILLAYLAAGWNHIAVNGQNTQLFPLNSGKNHPVGFQSP